MPLSRNGELEVGGSIRFPKSRVSGWLRPRAERGVYTAEDHGWKGESRSPLVPEGHRRKLAGGQSAPADAAPGSSTKKCSLPQRGIEETDLGPHSTAYQPTVPSLIATANETLTPNRTGRFSDAPLGHGSAHHVHRGPRPLARPCPRLISCGVPPGRGTARLARFLRPRLAVLFYAIRSTR